MTKTDIKTNGFLWLFLFYIAIFVCSCETEKLNKEYYLTEEQKKLIPYSGYDSIMFKTNKDDTVIYRGIGCVTKIDKVTVEKNKLYNLIETKSFNYFNSKDSSFINLNIGATINSDYTFNIIWQNKDTKSATLFNTIFFISNTIKKDKNQLMQDSSFFNSFIVLNKIYNDIYKIKDKHQDKIFDRNLILLYYNFNNGIIKVVFDNSDFLEII